MPKVDSTPVSFDTWKKSFLEELQNAPHSTARGNRFVQRILCDFFGYSTDDAVDATTWSGSGDSGVDGLIITESTFEGTTPEALVIQGKSSFDPNTFSPYLESKKYLASLKLSIEGKTTTGAIDRCANLLKNQGIIRYVIATIDALSETQNREIDDIRTIARDRFGDQLIIQTVCLNDIYSVLPERTKPIISVTLKAQGVQPTQGVFVGVSSLVDVYAMMKEYSTFDYIDTIYDLNVRKWLKKRGSVNGGIFNTLKTNPEKFVAFNNGITLICRNLRETQGVLTLEEPYIVNGCQTTRTLFEYMQTIMAGVQDPRAHSGSDPYREAFLPLKIIANADDMYRKDITRYSNKQNALRGRDFLSLEDQFRTLKEEMEHKGYFLQVQAGEYDALPLHQKTIKMIEAFDALRFYAAAVLGKPTTAFGRSGEFTPGGDEFERATNGITVDDLILPWLMAQEAIDLGYSAGAKRTLDPTEDDHRNQTRYFFLFILFKLSQKILFNKDDVDIEQRQTLYGALQKLYENYRSLTKVQREKHPFTRLLAKADQSVATYMILAKSSNWYIDRNAFLKSQPLLLPERFHMATGGALVDVKELRSACHAIISIS